MQIRKKCLPMSDIVSKISIRIAENESDIRAASCIHAEGWRAAYGQIFSESLLAGISDDKWINVFRESLTSYSFEIAILSIDDEDVGTGTCARSRTCGEKNYGEIISIYFLEKAWGLGYAKLLIEFMMDRLKYIGCGKIHLWVLEDNGRARSFYEKTGFVKTENKLTITVRNEQKQEIEYIAELG